MAAASYHRWNARPASIVPPFFFLFFATRNRGHRVWVRLSLSTTATAAKLAFDAAVTVAIALFLSWLRQGSIRVRGFGCERNQEDKVVGFEGEVKGKRPE